MELLLEKCFVTWYSVALPLLNFQMPHANKTTAWIVSLCMNRKAHMTVHLANCHTSTACLKVYPHCCRISGWLSRGHHFHLPLHYYRYPSDIFFTLWPSHCAGKRRNARLWLNRHSTLSPSVDGVIWLSIPSITCIIFINNITCVFFTYFIVLKFYLFAINPFSHSTDYLTHSRNSYNMHVPFYILHAAHSMECALCSSVESTCCMCLVIDSIVSGNDPQFSSSGFGPFYNVNGVQHICMCLTIYHPASNGLAERCAQALKKAMMGGVKDGLSFKFHLTSFLLTYQTTVQKTADAFRFKLLTGCSLRTHLDMLCQDNGARVFEKQEQQKQQHDAHAQERMLHIAQFVKAHDFSSSSRWLTGIKTWQLGPLTYLIQLTEGNVWRRHLDQLRARGGVWDWTNKGRGWFSSERRSFENSMEPHFPKLLQSH